MLAWYIWGYDDYSQQQMLLILVYYLNLLHQPKLCH